mmetsp:Transcript_14345/g.26923  ORF Transcript_14345/g.26923 Transcript_14345/m.26923 type:complete len:239 (+) Transcript_14345:118-834(+)
MKGYSRVNPLELEENEDENYIENQVENVQDEAISYFDNHSNRHIIMCLLFVFAMALSSVLSLIAYGLLMRVILNLTGRWFVCGITSFLQFLEKIIIYTILKRIIRKEIGDNVGGDVSMVQYRIPVFEDDATTGQRICNVKKGLCFLVELTIIAVIGISYTIFVPMICREIVNQLFRGIDGVIDYDWNHEGNQFALISFISRMCGIFFLISATFGIVALIFAASGGGVGVRGTGGIEKL